MVWFPQSPLVVAVLHEVPLFRRPRCGSHPGRCPCRPSQRQTSRSRRPPSRFAKPVVISRVRVIWFRWVNCYTSGHHHTSQRLSVSHKPNRGAPVRDPFEPTQLLNSAFGHHCCSGNDAIEHSKRSGSAKWWACFFFFFPWCTNGCHILSSKMAAITSSRLIADTLFLQPQLWFLRIIRFLMSHPQLILLRFNNGSRRSRILVLKSPGLALPIQVRSLIYL